MIPCRLKEMVVHSWITTLLKRFYTPPSFGLLEYELVVVPPAPDPCIYTGQLIPRMLSDWLRLIDPLVVDALPLRVRRQIQFQSCWGSMEDMFESLSYITRQIGKQTKGSVEAKLSPDRIPLDVLYNIDLDIMLTNNVGELVILDRCYKALRGMLDKLAGNWEAVQDEFYIAYCHRRLDHVLNSMYMFITAVVKGISDDTNTSGHVEQPDEANP